MPKIERNPNSKHSFLKLATQQDSLFSCFAGCNFGWDYPEYYK
jgi:hypothetical protein